MSKYSNLTQEDITKRLQAAACCSGALGNDLNNQLLYGLKCEKDFLHKLHKLNAYIKILCDYEVEYETSTNASAKILFTAIAGGPIYIYVENEIIGSYTPTSGESVADILTALAAAINSTTSNPDYTATADTDELSLTITAADGTETAPNGFKVKVINAASVGGTCLTGTFEYRDIVDVDDGSWNPVTMSITLNFTTFPAGNTCSYSNFSVTSTVNTSLADAVSDLNTLVQATHALWTVTYEDNGDGTSDIITTTDCETVLCMRTAAMVYSRMDAILNVV